MVAPRGLHAPHALGEKGPQLCMHALPGFKTQANLTPHYSLPWRPNLPWEDLWPTWSCLSAPVPCLARSSGRVLLVRVPALSARHTMAACLAARRRPCTRLARRQFGHAGCRPVHCSHFRTGHVSPMKKALPTDSWHDGPPPHHPPTCSFRAGAIPHKERKAWRGLSRLDGV